MFIALSSDRYALIRPLFAAIDYHLIIEAVIVGNSPATVFVDNLDAPQTVFMHSPEGDFLAGEPNNAAFNQGMQTWLEENFIHGEEEEFVPSFHPETWGETIQKLLVQRPPVAYERFYYETNAIKLSPPALASEFKLQVVTEEFIAQSHIQNIAVILDAIESNWSSQALFFEKGFALCVLHEDEVISWSVVDCVVAERCEVGIHTKPEFQRRGLATALIAAVIDYAFAHGFKQIGWHCWVDNWGSIGVADKVGLVQKERYLAYMSLQSELIHHAFTGYKRLQVQDYQTAEAAYHKSIAAVDDDSRFFLPRVYFEMAQVQAGLGKDAAAFDALREALAIGMKPTATRLNVPEFAKLKNSPEWQKLFS